MNQLEKWFVSFDWPRAGVKYYTIYTKEEAIRFANMFGKDITINEETKTINVK